MDSRVVVQNGWFPPQCPHVLKEHWKKKENMIKCPLWCPSSGENLLKCPLTCFSSGENVMKCLLFTVNFCSLVPLLYYFHPCPSNILSPPLPPSMTHTTIRSFMYFFFLPCAIVLFTYPWIFPSFTLSFPSSSLCIPISIISFSLIMHLRSLKSRCR